MHGSARAAVSESKGDASTREHARVCMCACVHGCARVCGCVNERGCMCIVSVSTVCVNCVPVCTHMSLCIV